VLADLTVCHELCHLIRGVCGRDGTIECCDYR